MKPLKMMASKTWYEGRLAEAWYSTVVGPYGQENQALERENCLDRYINNRVKETFMFRNRL